MSTLWRKIKVPGSLNAYKFEKTYREGPSTLFKNSNNLPIPEKIRNSVQKVNFLEVDTFQGVPVDVGLTENTPDPFLERNLENLK